MKKSLKTFQTKGSHRTKFHHPILLSAGQRVVLGVQSTDEGWEGWIWSTDAQNQAGWVPIQLINCADDMSSGVMLENYSARELNIDSGELVNVLNSMNGWSWVRRLSNADEGWIPNNILMEPRLNTY